MNLAGTAAFGLGLVLLASSRARAGNDDELPVGNRAALTGGAVAATVEDASATWYNPAGLGAIERDTIEVSGSAYTVRFYVAPRFIRARSNNAHDETFSEFVTIPTQIAFALRLADHVTLGLGYFAPRANDVILRVGLTDAEDDWSVAVNLKDVRYAAGAGLGVQLASNLRVGGALLGHYHSRLEAGSLFGVAREAQEQDPTRIAQVGFVTTEDVISLGATAGIQWDVSELLTLAATARTPELAVASGGTVNVQRSFTDVASDELQAMSFDEPSSQADPGHLQNLGRYLLAAALRFGWGSVRLEGDVQPAYSNHRANVERSAVVNGRVAVLARASEHLSVGFGLFSDRTSHRLSDDSLLDLEAHFYGVSTGLELSNRYALSAGQRHDSIAFSTSLSLRYAYSDARTLAVTVDRQAPFEGVFTGVPSSMHVHELGLYLGSGVYF